MSGVTFKIHVYCTSLLPIQSQTSQKKPKTTSEPLNHSASPYLIQRPPPLPFPTLACQMYRQRILQTPQTQWFGQEIIGTCFFELRSRFCIHHRRQSDNDVFTLQFAARLQSADFGCGGYAVFFGHGLVLCGVLAGEYRGKGEQKVHLP